MTEPLIRPATPSEVVAEIKRLRDENHELSCENGRFVKEIARLNAHITKQDTEIERLRILYDQMRTEIEHHRSNLLSTLEGTGKLIKELQRNNADIIEIVDVISTER